jgi:hypothetical protein
VERVMLDDDGWVGYLALHTSYMYIYIYMCMGCLWWLMDNC